MAKPTHKSKTVNFGGLLAILGALQTANWEWLPDEYVGPLLVVIGAIVAFLRYKTSQPLDLPGAG